MTECPACGGPNDTGRLLCTDCCAQVAIDLAEIESNQMNQLNNHEVHPQDLYPCPVHPQDVYLYDQSVDDEDADDGHHWLVTDEMRSAFSVLGG